MHAADVEALDPVVDRVARGQHQDRGPVARLAHPATDLEAVELGHPDIEDHRVGRRFRERVERLLAVTRELDVVAVESQGTLECPLDGRLVDGVITVTASEYRSQLRNREAAAARMSAMLTDATAPPRGIA